MKKEINVDKVIGLYADLSKKKKDIDTQMATVKGVLKEYMERKGIEACSAISGSATYTKSKRVSYNSSRLVELFGDEKLAPARKETEYTSVRITPSKDIQ